MSSSEGSFAFTGVDVTTPAVIATISFDALAPGASGLVLGSVLLSDSLGFGIVPVSWFDGDVTVTPAPAGAPVPGSLPLLAIALVLLALPRIRRIY